MATSKLIKNDTLTETSNAADGFNPAKDDSKLSYTSARVAKPVYNKYKASASKPKVFGYYTDWSQYDSRLQGIDIPEERGRGYDLTNVSPTAYDKLILGFVGITGFKKNDKLQRDVVAEAAAACGKVKYEPTFLDPWGDFQSYVNLGFDVSGWDVDPMTVTQANSKGMLGALRDLQAKAKAQGHTLALSMSIGGWSMSNGFHEMAAADSSRKIFAKGVVKLFKQFPMFSEVDIDWEYPNNEGAGNPFGEEDGANYALLIGELRKQLDSAGLSNVKISIAASAVTTIFDYARVKDLLAAGLYGINLMTYDFFGTPWAETLGHHTNRKALVEGGWSVETIVDHLLAEGFPADRINIGYAGYTRNARNVEIESLSPLKGAYNPGKLLPNGEYETTTGSFESGTSEWYDVIYNYLDLENQKGRNGFNVYTDQVADADYLFNPESKLFMSLDTPRTVKAKGEYAAKLGLGGVFTWTIDQDNGVLVNAVREGLGYEMESETIDMEPFYFEGINVEQEEKDDAVTDINHAPKAAIELLVVGGSTVQLSGAGSSDEDDDALSYSWGVPSDIAVADKTAEVIEFVVPEVSEKTAMQFTLFVRDCYNEPSTQQRFVLTVVPALSQVQPEPEEEEDEIIVPVEPEEDTTPAEDETPAAGETTPYAQWNATTVYGGNWGSFEIVSWKGHNYQVKWWSMGDQPDLNCGNGAAWTDLGAY